MRNVKIGVIALLAGMVGTPGAEAASSMDDALSAIARLEEVPSFAWRTTLSGAGGATGFPTTGQCEPNGYAVIRMDTPRGIGITVGCGDRSVSETQYGWLTPDRARRLYDLELLPRYRTPIQELYDMVFTCSRLSIAGSVITGTFDARTAKNMWMILLGTYGGSSSNRRMFFQDPKGDFRIWLRNGNITRYELHLDGIGDAWGCFPSTRNVTTVTEISGVGATRITIPYGAKAALDELD